MQSKENTKTILPPLPARNYSYFELDSKIGIIVFGITTLIVRIGNMNGIYFSSSVK